jgi:ATP-dependent DNA helicase RecG
VKANTEHSSGHQTAGGPSSQTIQEKLARLGIKDEFDLALHLPLRYDDETHLYPISDVPLNKTVQVEGNITRSEILFRPRRQLVCQVEDGSGTLVMRFLNL